MRCEPYAMLASQVRVPRIACRSHSRLTLAPTPLTLFVARSGPRRGLPESQVPELRAHGVCSQHAQTSSDGGGVSDPSGKQTAAGRLNYPVRTSRPAHHSDPSEAMRW